VVNATFDMMDKLGASEHQLDFPVSHLGAARDGDARSRETRQQYEAAVPHDHRALSRRPAEIPTDRCSCRSANLDYSSYVGRIGIVRISRGS